MTRVEPLATFAAHVQQGLRRDGGPLGVSLLLHLAALLLIAPWLVVRSVPAPEVAVEVMLEPDTATQARAQPERAARQRAPARTQSPKSQPQVLKTVEVQLNEQRRAEASPRAGQGTAGRRAVAREAAGLAAPRVGSAARSAAHAPAQGATAWVRSATRPSPLAPSIGSTPQPSSTHRLLQARPGEDRSDGAVKLAGPVPQSQAAQPEFRQAARQGGHQSLAGGSRVPADALSRASGLPQESALLAAQAAPQSLPGGSGAVGGTQPRVAAAFSSGTPLSSAARTGVVGTSPMREGLNRLAGVADPRVIGSGIAPAGRAPGGSGLSNTVASGQGSGGAPGERNVGTLVAARPDSGLGGATLGSGSGIGSAGSGRAAQGGGSSLAGRDTATLLAASGSGQAYAARESGQGRLSERAESAPRAQPSSESRAAAVQAYVPEGEARVIEERFTSSALKVDSPTSICELPLMFAGLDSKPIPQGLDTINVSGARLAGETPPRHQPGNQQPRYPIQALGQGAEGRVLVRAEVLADGGIGKHWVKQGSGFAVLDQAALDTVRRWRFTPAQRHGMATAMWMDVPIEYKMPSK